MQANYCEADSDCQQFQPGGFSCKTYVHKSFISSVFLERVDDFRKVCPLRIFKCPG
jgi:hypothetical protein